MNPHIMSSRCQYCISALLYQPMWPPHRPDYFSKSLCYFLPHDCFSHPYCFAAMLWNSCRFLWVYRWTLLLAAKAVCFDHSRKTCLVLHLCLWLNEQLYCLLLKILTNAQAGFDFCCLRSAHPLGNMNAINYRVKWLTPELCLQLQGWSCGLELHTMALLLIH